MIMRFEEKIADYRESHQRRNITGDFYAKGVGQHNRAEKKNRIHRAVLQKQILLDRPDIPDGESPDDIGSEAVAQNDQRHGKREGESAQHSVDGKCRVDYFEKNNLTDVRQAAFG